MGETPQIAAAWLDSPYTDLTTSISDRLVSSGYPTFLIPGGYLMAALRGHNLLAYSPLTEAAKLDHRPLFVVHTIDDPVLPSRYAQVLVDAIHASGGDAELWLVAGAQHVGAMFAYPDEYAQRLTAFFDAHLR